MSTGAARTPASYEHLHRYLTVEAETLPAKMTQIYSVPAVAREPPTEWCILGPVASARQTLPRLALLQGIFASVIQISTCLCKLGCVSTLLVAQIVRESLVVVLLSRIIALLARGRRCKRDCSRIGSEQRRYHKRIDSVRPLERNHGSSHSSSSGSRSLVSLQGSCIGQ